MAMTLTEAAQWTTNQVKRGILEQIVKDSPIMAKLPFQEVTGNALQYQREASMPTAEFHDVNEIWAESTGTTTQQTAALKILGGDADLDNFILATRADKNDIRAETIAEKAKAVKHAFMDKFWYGDTATSTKEFDGVHKMFLDSSMSSQQIHEGAAGAGSALNATNLDMAVDLIRDGRPNMIVTTREIRRRMKQYLRSKANVELDFQSYSQDVASWNGIPIEYDDFLVQTETVTGTTYSAKTGGATGSLFILSFGAKELSGLQNGGMETLKIGQVQNKDATRWRIKWYVSLALFRTIREGLIDGITDVAMVD